MLLIQINITFPRPLGPLSTWFGKQWSVMYMWMKQKNLWGGLPWKHYYDIICHNPSFGLATKARACKSAGQEGGPKGTSYTPGSVGECERISLHTPKWALIWGVGVSMDSWIFKEQLQESKPTRLKSYLYHWKALETKMSKMGSHDPFRYLKHKLWPKKAGNQIGNLIPDH